ncbi:unnamed protein product [Caenorhabditis bovis]|uniref:Cation efflux protein transmembrane domain-containing protein n=1 Tax=Caenorhabditis bovis TaxID=2654633 RepID=A0A8S1EJ47_9PELO|nr:unnamed protein product [Caenorhabditis bovis]
MTLRPSFTEPLISPKDGTRIVADAETMTTKNYGGYPTKIFTEFDMKSHCTNELLKRRDSCNNDPDFPEAPQSIAVRYMVINNCEHDTINLEEDLKLKGDPVESTSGINVNKVSKRLLVQIVLSLLFCFIEFIFGIISGSIALIADSYHMAADVMALIVAYICLRMAHRESKSNSYGWVRAEALGGFFNGLFLLTVCLNIFQEATGRIIHPKIIGRPVHVLMVGVVGLLINIVGLLLLNGQGHGHSHGGGSHGHSHGGHSHSNGHGHSHTNGKQKAAHNECSDHLLANEETELKLVVDTKSRTGTIERRFTGPGMPYASHLASDMLDEQPDEKKLHKKSNKNVNIRGVYLHLMSDAIGSVIVIFAASIVYFYPTWEYSAYFDPVLSLCLASMMSFSAFGLVRESVYILLMKPPRGIDNKVVESDLKKISGVVDVACVEMWSLTGSRHIASALVKFCHPAVFTDAAFKIRKYFHDLEIHSTTIEPSFEIESTDKEDEIIISDPIPIKAVSMRVSPEIRVRNLSKAIKDTIIANLDYPPFVSVSSWIEIANFLKLDHTDMVVVESSQKPAEYLMTHIENTPAQLLFNALESANRVDILLYVKILEKRRGLCDPLSGFHSMSTFELDSNYDRESVSSFQLESVEFRNCFLINHYETTHQEKKNFRWFMKNIRENFKKLGITHITALDINELEKIENGNIIETLQAAFVQVPAIVVCYNESFVDALEKPEQDFEFKYKSHIHQQTVTEFFANGMKNKRCRVIHMPGNQRTETVGWAPSTVQFQFPDGFGPFLRRLIKSFSTSSAVGIT